MWAFHLGSAIYFIAGIFSECGRSIVVCVLYFAGVFIDCGRLHCDWGVLLIGILPNSTSKKEIRTYHRLGVFKRITVLRVCV
jgi:hypothetical protein